MRDNVRVLPYGEAVLILVLFRVLFLVSNEAKGCSTPNSTPLVGVLFVVLHSNGVLFVVFSFKFLLYFWSAENSSIWSAPIIKISTPFSTRHLITMQVSSANWSVESSTKWSAQMSVICSAVLQTECCLWCIASSLLEC